jgi:hypothetical protein
MVGPPPGRAINGPPTVTVASFWPGLSVSVTGTVIQAAPDDRIKMVENRRIIASVYPLSIAWSLVESEALKTTLFVYYHKQTAGLVNISLAIL